MSKGYNIFDVDSMPPLFNIRRRKGERGKTAHRLTLVIAFLGAFIPLLLLIKTVAFHERYILILELSKAIVSITSAVLFLASLHHEPLLFIPAIMMWIFISALFLLFGIVLALFQGPFHRVEFIGCIVPGLYDCIPIVNLLYCILVSSVAGTFAFIINLDRENSTRKTPVRHCSLRRVQTPTSYICLAENMIDSDAPLYLVKQSPIQAY